MPRPAEPGGVGRGVLSTAECYPFPKPGRGGEGVEVKNDEEGALETRAGAEKEVPAEGLAEGGSGRLALPVAWRSNAGRGLSSRAPGRRWRGPRSRRGDPRVPRAARGTLSLSHRRLRNASRFPHRSLAGPRPEGVFH